MNIRNLNPFVQWHEISMFFADMLAVCFAIVHGNKVVVDNPDSLGSIITKLVIGLFKLFFAVVSVSFTALWVLYTAVVLFNFTNRVTEGFAFGPDWLNPPFWLIAIFIIPVPFCVYFLESIRDAVWSWLKSKSEA